MFRVERKMNVQMQCISFNFASLDEGRVTPVAYLHPSSIDPLVRHAKNIKQEMLRHIYLG